MSQTPRPRDLKIALWFGWVFAAICLLFFVWKNIHPLFLFLLFGGIPVGIWVLVAGGIRLQRALVQKQGSRQVALWYLFVGTLVTVWTLLNITFVLDPHHPAWGFYRPLGG